MKEEPQELLHKQYTLIQDLAQRNGISLIGIYIRHFLRRCWDAVAIKLSGGRNSKLRMASKFLKLLPKMIGWRKAIAPPAEDIQSKFNASHLWR